VERKSVMKKNPGQLCVEPRLKRGALSRRRIVDKVQYVTNAVDNSNK